MATKLVATKDGHTVTVDVDGADVKVSVDGVKGSSCKDLTRKLEESLGKESSSEPTSEMYQADGVNVRA